ncbi:MAG: hypothetical protein SNJ64_05855 [Endomicrobiia bacterium]
MFSIPNYYKNRTVKQRIAEYCGSEEGLDTQKFSCEYLVGVKEKISCNNFFLAVENEKFSWLLKTGADIFRSVWDKKATLFVLDFEYYNTKYIAEPFFNPQEVYFKLEEIYQRIKKIYHQYKINYISIQTGQGYHFVFKLPYDNPLHDKLISLSEIEFSLKGKYSITTPRRGKIISKDSAYGFHNAGRILEFFTHILLQNLSDYKGLPVMLGDVSVGNNKEAISIDLSMYGDPIYLRDIRIPFSSYQKHKIYPKFKTSTQHIKPFIVLPRETNGVEHFTYKELLSIRSVAKKVIEYSSNIHCAIPSVEKSFELVLSDYQNSALYKIHKNFDSVEQDNPNIWYKTYDRFDVNILPLCVSHCLIEPNDHLLKPTNLQTLTRVLLKLGWHPKHIAGLVRSKYERNYGWGGEWFKYDASSRANFYVRIYSDLVLSGIDKKEDLNCVSHQEKGYCFKPNCGFNLQNYK